MWLSILFLDNYARMRGVVPCVQMNFGELRDVATKGAYLPLNSLMFYPDHRYTYELKLR